MKNLFFLVMMLISMSSFGQMTPTPDGQGYELRPSYLSASDMRSHIPSSQVGCDTIDGRLRMYITYDLINRGGPAPHLRPKIVGERVPRSSPVFLNIGDVGYIFQTTALYRMGDNGEILFGGDEVESFLILYPPDEPSQQ